MHASKGETETWNNMWIHRKENLDSFLRPRVAFEGRFISNCKLAPAQAILVICNIRVIACTTHSPSKFRGLINVVIFGDCARAIFLRRKR